MGERERMSKSVIVKAMAVKTKTNIKSMIVIVTGTNGISSAGIAYAEKQLLCLYIMQVYIRWQPQLLILDSRAISLIFYNEHYY